MQHIRNMQERLALRAKVAAARPEPWLFGDLLGYDPSTMRVKVQIQNHFDPNGALIATETVWMPLVTPFLGRGYGEQFSPPPGAQVLVLRSADGDQWVAIGFTSNINAQPPNPSIATGEWQVTNAANENVAIKSALEGAVQIGDLTTLTGNPNRVLREKDLYPLITALNAHKHTGVQTGGGNTGTPSATFTNPAGSTTIKGGD